MKRRALIILALVLVSVFVTSWVNSAVRAVIEIRMGGSALLGGTDERGRHYLRNRAVVTHVPADTYRRLHRYERVSNVLFEVGFWALVLLLVLCALAQRFQKKDKAPE